MQHRINDILAFLYAVETGSISAAAQRMCLSKSVISKRISDLEALLGVKLLHRSTRGVIATDKGTTFYRRTHAIILQLDQVSEELIEQEGKLCGLLRIAAPVTLGTKYLGPVLFAFTSNHPKLSLALELNDQITDLSREGYDLGFRIGQLRDSSLIAHKLAKSRRVVCCSPIYAQSNGLPDSIGDLTNHACIGYANATTNEIWQFEPEKSGGSLRSVIVRGRIVANNVESIRDAAIAGLGIAILPAFVAAQALADGQLINVLPDERPTADDVCAVYPQAPHIPIKVRAIIKYLTAAFRKDLTWNESDI
ncbi:MAG: LysR family transcriptional regulator [Nitrosomonas sp.]|nr:LysR family transcriptional regulator [Nitrosomonas sp.]